MIVKIPFFKGKKIILEAKFEQNFDEVLISILKNDRWLNIDGLWVSDKIKAIKFLRNMNNTFGLGEAKIYIENLMKKNNIYPMTNDDWVSYKANFGKIQD